MPPSPRREVVGYGSLGSHRWRYPNPKKSDPLPIQIIPLFGIDKRFHGFPPGSPAPERFASRVFEDLLTKAIARVTTHGDLLGLLVDRRNVRAARFYERKEHRAMIVQLPSPL